MNSIAKGLLLMATLMGGAQGAAGGEAFEVPKVELPARMTHPTVAATARELARVREAFAGKGPDHDAVAAFVRGVERELAAPIAIPPEGGQHNQWYQCDRCQMGLTTVDAHHHKCPKCERVYSGYPYDNVLYTHAHHANSAWMERAAWAWAITGRKEFANRAADLLRRYADIYLTYPPIAAAYGKPGPIPAGETYALRSAGRILNQTLNESMWLVEAAAAYDLLHDALTPEDRERIETRLIRPMVATIAKHPAGKSNWQTWHNAALLWAGGALGDAALVRKAIADPANGFCFQMTVSVSDDGMWYENSWGYHYYTLRAMTHLAEGARRLGVDLYAHPSLRKMYLIGPDYRMSDGSLPRFGDSVQDAPTVTDVNEPAFAAYRDDRLLALLPGKASLQSVLHGRDTARAARAAPPVSRLFPGAGHAVLHAPGPAGLSAAVTFGPYGGFHGHFDKLSFVFFGHGQELGVDPGRSASQAYRLPIHQNWYKATVGHNAVLVDGNGQAPATGRCLFFDPAQTHAAVAVACDDALPGVRQRRLLLLTDRFLMICDELEAADAKPHVYWWVYHNRGEKVECDEPAGDGKLPAARGFEYFADVACFKPAGGISVRFPGKDATVHLRMAAGGSELFTATGPLGSVRERAAAVLVRQAVPAGATARFLAVFEPVAGAGKPTVSRLAVGPDGGGLAITVEAGPRRVRVGLPEGRISPSRRIDVTGE